MKKLLPFLLTLLVYACSSDSPEAPEKPVKPEPDPDPIEKLSGDYESVDASLSDFLKDETNWTADKIVSFLKTVDGLKDITVNDYNVEFYTADDYLMGVQLEPTHFQSVADLSDNEINKIAEDINNSLPNTDAPTGENFFKTEELFPDITSNPTSDNHYSSRSPRPKTIMYQRPSPLMVVIWCPIADERKMIMDKLESTCSKLYHGSWTTHSFYNPTQVFNVLKNKDYAKDKTLKLVFMETHGTPQGWITIPVKALDNWGKNEYKKLTQWRGDEPPTVINLYQLDKNGKPVIGDDGKKILKLYGLLPLFYEEHMTDNYRGTFAYTSICHIYGDKKHPDIEGSHFI